MSRHIINIEYGERYTDFVVGMYVDTSLADDLDMLGWNLCDCDDARFEREIGGCEVVSETVGNGAAEIVVELNGLDDGLKDSLVEEYQSEWEDFVEQLTTGILSRV